MAKDSRKHLQNVIKMHLVEKQVVYSVNLALYFPSLICIYSLPVSHWNLCFSPGER